MSLKSTFLAFKKVVQVVQIGWGGNLDKIQKNSSLFFRENVPCLDVLISSNFTGHDTPAGDNKASDHKYYESFWGNTATYPREIKTQFYCTVASSRCHCQQVNSITQTFYCPSSSFNISHNICVFEFYLLNTQTTIFQRQNGPQTFIAF